jgi:hypothetical protein
VREREREKERKEYACALAAKHDLQLLDVLLKQRILLDTGKYGCVLVFQPRK